VAADVRRLTFAARVMKFEPPYVGCHGFFELGNAPVRRFIFIGVDRGSYIWLTVCAN